MAKINKHIEIVRSSIPSLSSMSQRSCNDLTVTLSEQYVRVGVSVVNNILDLDNLVAYKPDLVFLGMKFVPLDPVKGFHDPAKIWITEYLDKHSVAYTGSSQKSHELELNKPLAKQRAQDAGLSTSSFVVSGNEFELDDAICLTFPVFIKPTNRGGGLGIDKHSVARNMAELRSKVRSIATKFGSDSLIEEYLPGREFSVAILKKEHSAEYSIMPIELIAEADEHGIRLLSGDVKTSNTERVERVAEGDIRSQVSELAMNVFHALGARDYGRIDIRMDALGTPQFLEANLLPSLISGYGSFPKACVLNEAIDYETMILHIVRLGLVRSEDAAQENLKLVPANEVFLSPQVR